MRSSRGFGGAAESITAASARGSSPRRNGYLAMLGREPPCRFDAS